MRHHGHRFTRNQADVLEPLGKHYRAIGLHDFADHCWLMTLKIKKMHFAKNDNDLDLRRMLGGRIERCNISEDIFIYRHFPAGRRHTFIFAQRSVENERVLIAAFELIRKPSSDAHWLIPIE